jgi:ATP-dependent DNA ligase
MCFDALHIDGRDIGDPYTGRRQALEQLRLTRDRWLTTPSLQREAGAALYGIPRKPGTREAIRRLGNRRGRSGD